MTGSLLIPIQEKEEPVKKKGKKQGEKDSEEKMNLSEEVVEKADKSVQLEQTERNVQMWKNCQVTIEHWKCTQPSCFKIIDHK